MRNILLLMGFFAAQITTTQPTPIVFSLPPITIQPQTITISVPKNGGKVTFKIPGQTISGNTIQFPTDFNFKCTGTTSPYSCTLGVQ